MQTSGYPLKNRTLTFLVFLSLIISLGYTASPLIPTSLPTITVEIPPHSNTLEIARRLTHSGVLTNPWGFVLGVFLDRRKTFAPGIYTFSHNISFSEAIDILKKPVVYKVTIPEGLTVAEIARHLNEQSFLTGGIFSTPPEGMLLPETYNVQYGDARETVIKRLEASMQKTLRTVWNKAESKEKLAEYGIKSELELLTLASIVEKETGVSSERPHVASVFLNRLAKKMRLQSDPTVSYAITNGKHHLGRSLSKQDLTTPSPMNTYTSAGLPPHPIACPGKAAMMAVVAPDDTQDLYFVADGTGGHRFSETLDGHNKNVNHWRKVQRGGADQGNALTTPGQ